MKGKRIISLLLAALLLLSGLPAYAEEDFETEEFDEFDTEEEEDSYIYTGPEYDPDHLVIGNPTKLSGNFMSTLWGYNTSDVDVMGLINGYNLILWDYAYQWYAADETVVDDLIAAEKAEGAKTADGGSEGGVRTYLIALNDQLKYSDGTPITAADYAFSILLQTCPEAKALGGNTENYPAILGVEAYKKGESKAISGVRILDEHILSITIQKDYWPFFYELGLIRCYPLPIHVIAPGCTVTDNGEGAEIEGPFTAELLEKTLLDPETGYVSHPSVVSGAYRVLDYDAESGIAEFEINDYYQGNFQGVKPSIRRITLVPADNETMIEKLAGGEIGLLNKCLKEDTITQGLELIAEGNYTRNNYARIGQSYISFNCEKPIVSSEKVRQAIACCLDKDETVARYSGNFGLRVDGYYGLGQWMYRALNGTLEIETNGDEEGEKQAEAMRALLEEISMEDLPRQELDTEKAVRLLKEDGWTEIRDGVRCKTVDGETVKLELTAVYPEGNQMGEILEETFLPYLAEAGILVHLEPMEWEQLLRQYYRQEARDCDMMYLGSNFNEVFDPVPTFNPDDAETGYTNYTGIQDEDLYQAARDLSMTDPGDVATYEMKWIEFQKQYAESMPAIPVYTNVYFDFYTRWLKNYNISEDITWSDSIIAAYMSDPEIPEEEEEDEESEGLVSF